VIDFVAIGLTSWLNIAGFYGGQPFNVAGYPLWWGAVDTANVLLGGALLYYLIPRLRGARRLYLLLIPMWVTGATAVAVAGPVAIALNSRWSMTGKVFAALFTIALGVGIVDLVASHLGRRRSELNEAGVSSQRWRAAALTPRPATVPGRLSSKRPPSAVVVSDSIEGP
jgi:hypothetical protein